MVGKVTSQGDRAIRASVVRKRFGINGKGIKIGVISDSFNALAGVGQDVRQGDLPGRNNPEGFRRPVRVLQDSNQGIDEGRALLQIIFDLAPGAELLFHTVGEDEQGFVNAINALSNAGADIIIDDILLSTSTFFQDGIVAQAVASVVEQGITYVTAAGNNGNRSYESQFRPSQSFTFRGTTYEAHDFDPGEGVDLFQDIQMPADAEIDLLLNWDQASGAVDTDLELFLMEQPLFPEAGGNILRSGTVLTRKGADPSQRISYFASSNQTVHLVIARRTDSSVAASPAPSAPAPAPINQIKWISFANTLDGDTTYQYVNDSAVAIGSSTVYGHQNARETIAVGAVPVRQTPAFGKSTPRLEDFSSLGGVPIVFDPQGNRLVSPELRSKPDIAAPDRVSTTVPGFGTFLGTSAAAPHVAAVVALMLQRAGGRRSLTPAQLLTAMQRFTIPIANSAQINLGLIQADAAVLQAYQVEQVGTAAADRLTGDDRAENFLGLAGNDTLQGAGRMDALWGGLGQDRLHGDRGNDYLVGDEGKDELIGGQGKDNLMGGQGRDRLFGNQGNNILRGGADADWFVLHRQGFAHIQDFQPGIDRIGLPRIALGRLDWVQAGQDTLIQLADRTLARLDRVAAGDLRRSDFREVVEVILF